VNAVVENVSSDITFPTGHYVRDLQLFRYARLRQQRRSTTGRADAMLADRWCRCSSIGQSASHVWNAELHVYIALSILHVHDFRVLKGSWACQVREDGPDRPAREQQCVYKVRGSFNVITSPTKAMTVEEYRRHRQLLMQLL